MNIRQLSATALALLLSAATATAGDYAKYYNDLPGRTGISLTEPQAPQIPDNTVSITDFGAIPDGVTLNTESFDSAIKAITKLGGGHILIPAGVWLSGPITLKDNIDLHLERNSIVLFTPDRTAYLKDGKVLPCISASKRHDISITGEGMIDAARSATPNGTPSSAWAAPKPTAANSGIPSTSITARTSLRTTRPRRRCALIWSA